MAFASDTEIKVKAENSDVDTGKAAEVAACEQALSFADMDCDAEVEKLLTLSKVNCSRCVCAKCLIPVTATEDLNHCVLTFCLIVV